MLSILYPTGLDLICCKYYILQGLALCCKYYILQCLALCCKYYILQGLTLYAVNTISYSAWPYAVNTRSYRATLNLFSCRHNCSWSFIELTLFSDFSALKGDTLRRQILNKRRLDLIKLSGVINDIHISVRSQWHLLSQLVKSINIDWLLSNTKYQMLTLF